MPRSLFRFFLGAAALVVPAAGWGQPGELADRQDGQGSETAFVVRGPAPPDLPEMVRRDDRGGATMRATRLEGPFEFDGRLDDAIYDRVPGVGDFIQVSNDRNFGPDKRQELCHAGRGGMRGREFSRQGGRTEVFPSGDRGPA